MCYKNIFRLPNLFTCNTKPRSKKNVIHIYPFFPNFSILPNFPILPISCLVVWLLSDCSFACLRSSHNLKPDMGEGRRGREEVTGILFIDREALHKLVKTKYYWSYIQHLGRNASKKCNLTSCVTFAADLSSHLS